jgi:hypothetical protein
MDAVAPARGGPDRAWESLRYLFPSPRMKSLRGGGSCATRCRCGPARQNGFRRAFLLSCGRLSCCATRLGPAPSGPTSRPRAASADPRHPGSHGGDRVPAQSPDARVTPCMDRGAGCGRRAVVRTLLGLGQHDRSSRSRRVLMVCVRVLALSAMTMSKSHDVTPIAAAAMPMNITSSDTGVDHARHERPPISGYLFTGRTIWPSRGLVEVSGGTLAIAAAHPSRCGSHLDCASPDTVTRRGSRGVCPARSSTAHLAVSVRF